MELLNRDYQRQLLFSLAEHYPQPVEAGTLAQSAFGPVNVNIAYLHEHGLVRGEWIGSLDRGDTLMRATITARGMDFLADDGGLGAILGVVTIRLDDETLKAIIEQRVRGSELSEDEKNRFVDQLRKLPGETTKHLVLKLVDAGLDNWQRALPVLQGLLS
ncbi:hypothetical protein [Stenotrophomonas muris]|uniref:hypothetical protein n=1 Tax=Stenotrophomonas muris TaxID=2963283 RepID=UPI002E79E26B|nr:hypothetical protein [Stenotrophomonas muris]